jgi:hypothetical protein
MRVARSAFVTMSVVVVAAVVPVVPASGAMSSVGKGVVGDRVMGERVTDLNDRMMTRQAVSGDPSMSTVTGADGVGCWWEPTGDGSMERTCSELILHTVAV